ncbi:hypothetical protein ACFY4K_27395 [Streptomyces leeuwenhoekii]|uniref:hypothetical protein n=1 Tax=Streptomyces leeuwenhoekii TaxID=1437453 RepID=UPI00368A06FD
MRTTTKRAGAAAVAAVAALAVCATPASGEPEPRPAWVTVGTAPPGSTLQTVQGTKDDGGGCAFDVRLSLAPGEKAVRADQIRIDPARCVTEMAVTRDIATAPATATATAPAGTAVESKRAAPTPAARESREARKAREGARAYVRSRGHYRTSWRDSAGREANAVRTDVDWSWNGQDCVLPGWGAYSYVWSTADGWQLGANDWRNVHDCDRQTSSSAVHYGNDGVFCPGADTDVYYDRTTVHGTREGRLESEGKSRVDGGCADRLAFHHELIRSL